MTNMIDSLLDLSLHNGIYCPPVADSHNGRSHSNCFMRSVIIRDTFDHFNIIESSLLKLPGALSCIVMAQRSTACRPFLMILDDLKSDFKKFIFQFIGQLINDQIFFFCPTLEIGTPKIHIVENKVNETKMIVGHHRISLARLCAMFVFCFLNSSCVRSRRLTAQTRRCLKKLVTVTFGSWSLN